MRFLLFFLTVFLANSVWASSLTPRDFTSQRDGLLVFDPTTGRE